MNYEPAQIRHFLQERFNDEELNHLCFDYFPDVQNDFTIGMRKGQKVQMLLEYCQRQGRWPALMAALERERSETYAEQFAAATPVESPLQDNIPVERNPRQVFISYAHQDAEAAQRLAADLRERDWPVWIAPENIRPGEKWVEAINRGLEESGIFLLVLTPSAVNSRWVQSETNIAIQWEHQNKIRFIPLRMRTNDVPNTPALWQGYQQIPFDNTYRVGLSALLTELHPKPTIVQRPRQIHSLPNQSSPASVINTKKTLQPSRREPESRKHLINVVPLWGWISLTLITILAVALVINSIYHQYERNQRFAEIKVEMGQNLGLADAAGDDAQASAYYNTVITLAAEGETLRPSDPEIAQLRQQAVTNLDRLGGVTRLTARPYHTFDETVQLTAVALQEGFNGGIYTLDGTGSQVFRHPTSEDYLTAAAEPELLVFNGQAVGSYVVNSIRDILWRPMGSNVTQEGLAMLDGTGAILTYYPNFADLQAVLLSSVTDWQLPLAMTTFAERLYILDSGARQIWKYYPEGDGFVLSEGERTLLFFDNPELEKAVDIAFYSEDGSLVVLYWDGRIRYYDTRSGRVQWDETYLLQHGLGIPLIAPKAVEMVGRGLNTSMFVADPGSGRLLEISRGGTVLAQYRASDSNGLELFTQMTDFAIVKTPLRVFVTAGNQLYLATQE